MYYLVLCQDKNYRYGRIYEGTNPTTTEIVKQCYLNPKHIKCVTKVLSKSIGLDSMNDWIDKAKERKTWKNQT